MANERPTVIVLAGPNGSGKTTAAPKLLRDVLGVAEIALVKVSRAAPRKKAAVSAE